MYDSYFIVVNDELVLFCFALSTMFLIFTQILSLRETFIDTKQYYMSLISHQQNVCWKVPIVLAEKKNTNNLIISVLYS